MFAETKEIDLRSVTAIGSSSGSSSGSGGGSGRSGEDAGKRSSYGRVNSVSSMLHALDRNSVRLFAVVSLVLSKHEMESSPCDEPLLCVHELLASELRAVDVALAMPPLEFKNAVLCVVPVGEWVNFEDAYDWCVQVQIDRREKRKVSTLTKKEPATRSNSALHNGNGGGGNGGGGATAMAATTTMGDAPPKPEWQEQKEKAHKLHHVICTRMGLKNQEKERKDDDGFTCVVVVLFV